MIISIQKNSMGIPGSDSMVHQDMIPNCTKQAAKKNKL